MRNKLQVFVSSTYSDLIEERQACVEAILRAGHIPAGMELFSAGSETQLEIIKRWIKESDIYMLLLGGRYGSIEPKSQISYAEVEYRYAIEIDKPIFAVVVSDELLDKKLKDSGKKVIEIENANKYKEFKELVLSRISRFASNNYEIKLAILESLLDIQSRYKLQGWSHASELPNIENYLNEIDELKERNKLLERSLTIVDSGMNEKIGQYSFNQLTKILFDIKIIIPETISDKKIQVYSNVLEIFLFNKEKFTLGIVNRVESDDVDKFLIAHIVSRLLIYELVEVVSDTSLSWPRYQTSRFGNKFLATFVTKQQKKPWFLRLFGILFSSEDTIYKPS